MKLYFALFTLLLFTVGCYPAYNIFIVNNTDAEIELETQPSIEKRIMIKQGVSYNKINSKKLNNQNDFEKGIYKLNPNDSIFLFGERGKLGNYLPFNFVKINKEHDSLIITNTNLVDNINNEKGSKYYIIIK